MVDLKMGGQDNREVVDSQGWKHYIKPWIEERINESKEILDSMTSDYYEDSAEKNDQLFRKEIKHKAIKEVLTELLEGIEKGVEGYRKKD